MEMLQENFEIVSAAIRKYQADLEHARKEMTAKNQEIAELRAKLADQDAKYQALMAATHPYKRYLQKMQIDLRNLLADPDADATKDATLPSATTSATVSTNKACAARFKLDLKTTTGSKASIRSSTKQPSQVADRPQIKEPGTASNDNPEPEISNVSTGASGRRNIPRRVSVGHVNYAEAKLDLTFLRRKRKAKWSPSHLQLDLLAYYFLLDILIKIEIKFSPS